MANADNNTRLSTLSNSLTSARQRIARPFTRFRGVVLLTGYSLITTAGFLMGFGFAIGNHGFIIAGAVLAAIGMVSVIAFAIATMAVHFHPLKEQDYFAQYSGRSHAPKGIWLRTRESSAKHKGLLVGISSITLLGGSMLIGAGISQQNNLMVIIGLLVTIVAISIIVFTFCISCRYEHKVNPYPDEDANIAPDFQGGPPNPEGKDTDDVQINFCEENNSLPDKVQTDLSVKDPQNKDASLSATPNFSSELSHDL